MIQNVDANVSHSFFYSASFGSHEEFAAKVRQLFKGACFYNVNDGEPSHPYGKDMQVAEKFLRGGGQTYRVTRFFMTEYAPALKEGEIDGWCVMLSYFEESSIVCVSCHYAVRNTDSDRIIGLRQSGFCKNYSFPQGELSPLTLSKEIMARLGVKKAPAEQSYLCEILRFGAYDSPAEMEKEQASLLYGLLSGDEGYEFVPEELVRERLKESWGSRDFIRIWAAGKAFLFVNLLHSPRHEAYLERQTAFGGRIYGGANPYFFLGECPLTVNHGILFSVEFVMMLKALINDVLAFQTEFGKMKKTSYYKRIRLTRDFRRKIIMVLEKVEKTEIAEVGELSSLLLDSQKIAPVVDQVKYLLELLEADLSLIYSEHNNLLVTILTVLGLLFAVWQIFLAY